MLSTSLRWVALRGPGMVLMGLLASCGFLNSEPEPGIYRAVIEAPEGELPFGLELETGGSAQSSAALGLFLLDGDKRLPLERVTRIEKAFEVQLPGGRSTLNFTARGAKLSGFVRLVNAGGEIEEWAFRAENGPAFRFFPESATDNADVAGRWSTSITGRAGGSGWRVADLTQSHDQLAGTFLGPAGMQQAVTGQVQGDDVRLSSFDGETALLFTGTVNDDGDLEGEYWSSLTGSARWTARRNPDAEVEDPAYKAATAL